MTPDIVSVITVEAGSTLCGVICTIWLLLLKLIDPAVTASVFRRLRRQAESSDALEALTAQERKILDLIAEGLTNREIAERIHLAERTVKNYVSHILSKLGMKHRTQAALYASKLRDSE